MTKDHISPPDYTYSDQLIREIIDLMSDYIDPEISHLHDTLMKTYLFARDAHEWQYRKSGEPYITHPLEAAKILLTLKPDIISVQSCILHDVIEDTEYEKVDIEERFWSEVALICEWLSKLSAIKYRGEERSIESLRKMFIAMVDDLRVIIVKLADRLHNMKTLEHHPDAKKRERIAFETLNIFAPIADRLGIFDFKEALETECFKVLYPDDYQRIQKELNELKEEQDFFLTKAQSIIREVVAKDVPVIDISYRIKSPLSIYRKLSRKEYSYNHARDLYDLFAIRIITDNIPHCYEILWVLHNVFVPMPKRFKDYIALPKENGYQSLHTTVVGLFPEVRSQPTEIQIRTPEMHRQAEIGVAAHFEYSETGSSRASKDSYWVQTIKTIVDAAQEGSEFMSEMRVNVFSDQIFVFTPKGDIITLPKWSTPIDFAYAIHSNLGNKLSIAKINGHVVPLDYQLHNGESIQIVIDQNKKPNPIWLSFVQTSKAKDHIRQFINREERSFFIEKGRFILNSYLEKHYEHGLDKELSILRYVDGNILDTKQKEDILVQLGNLSRKPGSVLKSIHDDIIAKQLGEKITDEKLPTLADKKATKKDIFDGSTVSVVIGKERAIPYRFAQCCNPTPDHQKIVWVIGQGIVTVHLLGCVELNKVELERRIPTHWSNQTKANNITCEFICLLRDRRWLLMSLTSILYNMGVDIKSIHAETQPDNTVIDRFIIETDEDDYYIYDRLESRLKFEIPELIEVELIAVH
jgi:GTP diphosphokinase / guanosine-3',5'-bis(diphosphate) 3'-diphosphatase